jgi:hypothetical protein
MRHGSAASLYALPRTIAVVAAVAESPQKRRQPNYSTLNTDGELLSSPWAREAPLLLVVDCHKPSVAERLWQLPTLGLVVRSRNQFSRAAIGRHLEERTGPADSPGSLHAAWRLSVIDMSVTA